MANAEHVKIVKQGAAAIAASCEENPETRLELIDTAWKSQTCKTFQEYLQAAYGKLDQAGHVHAFRGVNGCFENLRPSFDRRQITKDDRVKIETGLLEDFLEEAWNALTPQERHRCLLSEKRWGRKRNTAALVVARHRLVPTRCLDWSYQPLTALFFACRHDSETDDSEEKAEVWWFDRCEFDCRVRKQWRALFAKDGNVEPEIEEDFFVKDDAKWFTALNYVPMPGDRPYLQDAWITAAGRLGTCHAEEIERLGVCEKGRFVIPADLKMDAMRELEELGVTSESLGLNDGNRADQIGKGIAKKFEGKFEERKD